MVGKRVVAGVPRFGVSVQPMRYGGAKAPPGNAWRENGCNAENRIVPSKVNGVKQEGISGPRNNGKGDKWFQDGAARHGSKSNSRKAASAEIARIPFALANYIARAFKSE
jgi:hypothetical protein